MTIAIDDAARGLQDDDETVFAAFDSHIAWRFFSFVRPYWLWLTGPLQRSHFSS